MQEAGSTTGGWLELGRGAWARLTRAQEDLLRRRDMGPVGFEKHSFIISNSTQKACYGREVRELRKGEGNKL